MICIWAWWPIAAKEQPKMQEYETLNSRTSQWPSMLAILSPFFLQAHALQLIWSFSSVRNRVPPTCLIALSLEVVSSPPQAMEGDRNGWSSQLWLHCRGPCFSAKGRAIDYGPWHTHTGKDCDNQVQSCMAGLARSPLWPEGSVVRKLFLSFLCHDPALLLSLCSRPPIASIFLRLRDSASIFSTNSGPIFLR